MKAQNYFGDWDSWEDVTQSFYNGPSLSESWRAASTNTSSGTLEPKFIWAVYGGGSYDGSAEVIFFDEADKKWKQVEGSHCSCYGLEDQWNPDYFDVDIHLKAITEGKRLVNVESDYYDWTGSTNADFDKWIKWAAEQAK